MLTNQVRGISLEVGERIAMIEAVAFGLRESCRVLESNAVLLFWDVLKGFNLSRLVKQANVN